MEANTVIFYYHMLKIVEYYIDDIVVKSQNEKEHFKNLRTIFNLMKAHQLNMNPAKSFLGVSSGRFIGFVMPSKGFHLDPEKVKAIRIYTLQEISKNFEI